MQKSAAPIEVDFLRDLVLATGGHLLSSRLSAEELAGKGAIVVSSWAWLQRGEIDLKLVNSSQRPSLQPRRSKSAVAKEVTSVDYHWIVDSVYCQEALPL